MREPITVRRAYAGWQPSTSSTTGVRGPMRVLRTIPPPAKRLIWDGSVSPRGCRACTHYMDRPATDDRPSPTASGQNASDRSNTTSVAPAACFWPSYSRRCSIRFSSRLHSDWRCSPRRRSFRRSSSSGVSRGSGSNCSGGGTWDDGPRECWPTSAGLISGRRRRLRSNTVLDGGSITKTIQGPIQSLAWIPSLRGSLF